MINNKYTTIFWDWNGTIIDDLAVNFQVINSLLVEYGKTKISLTTYRKAFTFPIIDFYNRIGLPVTGEKYEQLVSDYWEKYKSKISAIPLMTGIINIIEELNMNNVQQYILSASDKKMVVEQMSQYNIYDYFADIIAPEDGYALGKVDLAKQWLTNHNDIIKSNVIMIGDTFHDFETASAIGIDCILIDKGHQDLRGLKNDSKILVVDDINILKLYFLE